MMTMNQFITSTEIKAAADYVRGQTQYQPNIGLILGSGLNSLADTIDDPDIIPTADIPNWPVSTVPGHAGRLVIGTLEIANRDVFARHGRHGVGAELEDHVIDAESGEPDDGKGAEDLAEPGSGDRAEGM